MPKKTVSRIKILKPLVLIVGLLVLVFLLSWLLTSRNWQTNQARQIAFWTGQSGGLISLQPESERAVVFVFPQNTLINTAKGFGDYPAKAIYSLGEQEKLGGGQFWRLSIQNFFGFPVDDFLILFNNQPVNQGNLTSWLLRSVLGYQDSLGFWDALKAWWFMKSLSVNDFKLINLTDGAQIELTKLADQTQVYCLNQNKIDQLVRNFLVEPAVAQSQLRWVIFNASGFSGAAGFWSRLINNLGGRVVHLGNEPRLEKSVIKLSNEAVKKDFLVQSLINKFDLEIEIEPTIFSGRGDVGLYIGQDLVAEFLSH